MPKPNQTHEAVVELLAANRKSQMTGIGPRDSDKELLIQFMQIHLGLELNARQLELLRTVNFESITRARRKLQENGEYLPDSEEVRKKRKLKAMIVEQTAPSESAAGLQRRIAEQPA